eukprot:182833-Rhodomonas_salina.2
MREPEPRPVRPRPQLLAVRAPQTQPHLATCREIIGVHVNHLPHVGHVLDRGQRPAPACARGLSRVEAQEQVRHEQPALTVVLLLPVATGHGSSRRRGVGHIGRVGREPRDRLLGTHETSRLVPAVRVLPPPPLTTLPHAHGVLRVTGREWHPTLLPPPRPVVVSREHAIRVLPSQPNPEVVAGLAHVHPVLPPHGRSLVGRLDRRKLAAP